MFRIMKLLVLPVVFSLAPVSAATPVHTMLVKDAAKLLIPVFKDPASDGSKLYRPELQLSSLKVPAPALILFFNRDGCLTAAVPTEQLEAVDENCFPGPSTPTISTFLKAEVDSGVPAIVLLSPLLDVDAVKSNFPGQDEVWDRQLEQFHDLDQTLRQQYPGAVMHHVYLPLGS